MLTARPNALTCAIGAALLGLSVLSSGCASTLQVLRDDTTPLPGVPVAVPVLVKVVEETTFDLKGPEEFRKYCVPEVNSSYKFMPVGERVYVAFNPAKLGKGEFKLELTESGGLKMVSLNSDASAAVTDAAGQLTDLVAAALPYVAAPKADEDARMVAADKTAAELKALHCLKKGTRVKGVVPVRVQKAPQ